MNAAGYAVKHEPLSLSLSSLYLSLSLVIARVNCDGIGWPAAPLTVYCAK